MRRTEKRSMEDELIIQQVMRIRKNLPKIGGRKLHYLLKDFMQEHNIAMGRDQLFDLLLGHKLLIKKRRRRISTTNSNHRFRRYPNLIKELEIIRPEQLWVSDITYLKTKQGFCYLSLITDAYSKKIIGYNLENNLATEGCMKALQMALSTRIATKSSLIHHSDRGIQYCSNQYITLLKGNAIAISMTENGDPYENAIAERVNGILKDEFNLYQTFINIHQANSIVQESIFYYNNQRPHATCNYLTPDQAHNSEGILNKKWKSYYRKNTVND